MVGIVIVGVIFASAVVIVPAMSYVNLQQVDQQQLRNTALNVFNAMLLGTGTPPQWGSVFPFHQDNVSAFGLAYSSESSLYVLDKDKVQRLDIESPGYIEYEYVRNLLGLEDYGFSLTIFRPFTVEWKLGINSDTNSVSFAINVTRNWDGRPIPNAQVDCTILCTADKDPKGEEPMIVVTTPTTFFTNAIGRCDATQTIEIPSGYSIERAVALLKITVAGMSTMVVAQTDLSVQEFIKLYTFGDTVVLTFRDELAGEALGERRVKNIMTYSYDNQLSKLYDGTGTPTGSHITHGLGYDYWNNTFPGLEAMNPALLLFTLSVPNPRRLVVVSGPFSLSEPSVVFRYEGAVSGVATQLRRYVIISGITYIAELMLWKE